MVRLSYIEAVPFMEEEVKKAVGNIKVDMASGRDGIYHEIMREVALTSPG